MASEDAYLVADHRELVARVTEIRGRRPEVALVVEEYLDGELRTFETLGDGTTLASRRLADRPRPATDVHRGKPRLVAAG
ncbi:hypothetical protein NKG94_31620 [Micromonospora sp. M12]